MLADHGVVPVGQGIDELGGTREPRRPLDRGKRRVRIRERDVLAHGVGEQERVFEHDPDRVPKFGDRERAQVDTVEQDPAGVDVVEARDEARDRRLPAAGRTDDRDGFTAANHQIQPVEHRSAGPVSEPDPLEAQLSRTGRERGHRGRLRIRNRRIRLEDLVDPARPGRRPRGLGDEHADHAQRPDQHQDVQVVSEDVTHLEPAVEHLVTAVPEDRDHRDGREEVDERHEPRPQACRRE